MELGPDCIGGVGEVQTSAVRLLKQWLPRKANACYREAKEPLGQYASALVAKRRL